MMKIFLVSFSFEKRKDILFCLILCSIFFIRVYSQQCHTSTLPLGASIGESCGFQPKNLCSIICKVNDIIKWKTQAQCLENGKWTPLPICKKIYTRSLKPTDCDKKFQPGCKKSNKCRTMNFSPRSSYLGRCKSQSVGSMCYLSCKGGGKFVGGKNYIICSKNARWTKPKKCFCPELIPPSEYALNEKCSEKLPGETCHVRCKDGADLKKSGYIKCLKSAYWGTFPPCTQNFCLQPLLSNKVKTLEDCSQKKTGETCKLSCENGGLLNTSEEIYCNPRLSWSPVPKCVCPKPILPSTIELQENCEGKAPGERCYISCKSPFTNNDNKSFIVCLMDSQKMWSTLPNCKCSYPTHLNLYVKLHEDCKDLKTFPIGKVCNVYCDNRGKVIGKSEIVCIGMNNWSSSPLCACAPPPQDLSLNLDNCLATLPGTHCKVSCKVGAIEKENLACDTYYNWDKLPICKVSCQNITHERDLIFHNCTNLMTGESCKVGCQNNAQLVGANSLICIENLRYKWMGVKPICVCLPPILTSQHILKENCFSKKHGEQCLIGCKDKNTDANSTCIMEENLMWTPLLQC